MTNDIAIKVENLSKRYRIGLKEEIPETLVEAATDFLTAPIRNFRRLRSLSTFSENSKDSTFKRSNVQRSNVKRSNVQRSNEDIIWALRDVSFEVERGEVVGIIGRNGAGKSTLLKILSRITHPTSGRVELNGRVSSLLEVGTGFHGEMTGRENVYLNGTILGMTKAEVDRKFDEIVAFSGVEKFIDTPVKRYSSGMRVRLAFSVAAHLEPEILLIDEVLAVGDVAFQKRCLGKIKNITNEGRTVLFVSHNMGAIQQLTERCILLDLGKMVKVGNSEIIVANYLESASENIDSQVTDVNCDLEGFHIKKLYFDIARLEAGFNKPLYFGLELDAKKDFSNVGFGFGIENSIGARVITFEKVVNIISSGKNEITFILENHHLPPGNYHLSIGFEYTSSQIIYIEKILSFQIPSENIRHSTLTRKGDRIGIYLVPKMEIKKQN